MSLKKKPTPKKLRPEIVVAIIGVIGVIGAAIIANVDKWSPKSNVNSNSSIAEPSRVPASNIKDTNSPVMDQSSKELIDLLNQRASRIVETMESEKQKALASLREGNGRASRSPEAEAEFLQELDNTQKLFIQLHEKHIEAIKNGKLGLAHDIVSDIHYLLWVRERNLFWEAYAIPSARYSRHHFPPPDTYVSSYPGEKPFHLIKKFPKQLAAIWMGYSPRIDINRIDRIKKQLEEMK
ncbi:MAG TPA: hypothetical protein VF644_06915 [Pyrinomonadaceae bacterium]|jgi:hypothetical protein